MMQTTFAGTTDLEEMVFTSAAKYNLEAAPTKSKPDYSMPGMPAYLINKLQEPDPSIPETKDLRKFVRRLTKLRSLKWSGRGGKGVWTFAKKTTLVNVSFKHSAIITQRDWEICQLDPPRFEYEEPATSKPTLLEMPPPSSILLASPISDFPSLSRSSTASTASQRRSISPSSPIHIRSASSKELNNRSQGLGITPEDRDEQDSPGPVTPKYKRRGTTDGSSPSVPGMSSISSGVGRSRQMSIDLSKSTKSLHIGDSIKSPSLTAPSLLKPTSAPTRLTDPPSGAGTSSGQSKVKLSETAIKGRKLAESRRSK